LDLGNPFYAFALLLAVTGLVSVIAHWLKQPLIVAFIGVGILVGPAGLKWVTIGNEIDLLAKTGVALLLFTVGLKLDLHVIRTMGPVALATGLGQVIFTSVIGFGICLALGLSPIASLYVAVALTFSSTIIIVKLLSDKREIDSLHGRIAVGFLIVQDIVVVLVMIVLTAFGDGLRGDEWGHDIGIVLLKGAGFVAAVALLMRYVLPHMFTHAARSPELLTTLAICWAILLAAAGDLLGFSKEVGAFLAGVSLASTSYREALGSRLVSLRDFLLLFFFVDLGAHLNLSMLGFALVPAIVLSLFVLIGNPLIVMAIMGWMGYRKRTGFLAGLTVAQISEFSLMLGALGKNLGHISSDVLGLITLVGLATITLSTYMILYSHWLYEQCTPLLKLFERYQPYREMALEKLPVAAGRVDVILFGMGRFGSSIARQLAARGARVLGVDFDPELVRRGRHGDVPIVYGDADDAEFLATLPLSEASWVVSSVPLTTVNLSLLQVLKQHEYRGKTAVTVHHDRDIATLRDAGADVVLLPFVDAAKEAADVLLADV